MDINKRILYLKFVQFSLFLFNSRVSFYRGTFMLCTRNSKKAVFSLLSIRMPEWSNCILFHSIFFLIRIHLCEILLEKSITQSFRFVFIKNRIRRRKKKSEKTERIKCLFFYEFLLKRFSHAIPFNLFNAHYFLFSMRNHMRLLLLKFYKIYRMLSLVFTDMHGGYE